MSETIGQAVTQSIPDQPHDDAWLCFIKSDGKHKHDSSMMQPFSRLPFNSDIWIGNYNKRDLPVGACKSYVQLAISFAATPEGDSRDRTYPEVAGKNINTTNNYFHYRGEDCFDHDSEDNEIILLEKLAFTGKLKVAAFVFHAIDASGIVGKYFALIHPHHDNYWRFYMKAGGYYESYALVKGLLSLKEYKALQRDARLEIASDTEEVFEEYCNAKHDFEYLSPFNIGGKAANTSKPTTRRNRTVPLVPMKDHFSDEEDTGAKGGDTSEDEEEEDYDNHWDDRGNKHNRTKRRRRGRYHDKLAAEKAEKKRRVLEEDCEEELYPAKQRFKRDGTVDTKVELAPGLWQTTERNTAAPPPAADGSEGVVRAARNLSLDPCTPILASPSQPRANGRLPSSSPAATPDTKAATTTPDEVQPVIPQSIDTHTATPPLDTPVDVEAAIFRILALTYANYPGARGDKKIIAIIKEMKKPIVEGDEARKIVLEAQLDAYLLTKYA